MNCPRCGAYCTDGDKFCGRCGMGLAASGNEGRKVKIRMYGDGVTERLAREEEETGPLPPPKADTPPYTPPTYTTPPSATVPPQRDYAPPYMPPVAPPPPYTATPGATAMPPVALPSAKSYFDGGFFANLGLNLLAHFVSVVSLGFAFPAMWCMKTRWIYSHTVVNGYRLRFDGSGARLFGKWMLWLLLTIVTLTIYSLWIPIQLKRWESKYVFIDRVDLSHD